MSGLAWVLPDGRTTPLPPGWGPLTGHRAAETYVFDGGGPLRTPVVVLTGDADPKTPLAQAEAWAAHTTAECALHVYRGGHFFLSDHVPAVLDLVRGHLTRVPVGR